MDEKVDLAKVVECQQRAIEHNSKENKVLCTNQAVMQDRIERTDQILSSLSKEVRAIEAQAIQTAAKSTEIERRLVKHKDEHKENYKELQGSLLSLSLDFDTFRNGVFRRLDVMAGRDGVLKLIFGGILGALGMLLLGFIKSKWGI